MGPIFFSPGDIHTKGMLFSASSGSSRYLRLILIQKGGLDQYQPTPSNEFSACVPSEYSTTEQLASGAFLKDCKIANDTNINHIMVSFTNYYNNISIDRLPSKAKIGKYSWYFNNSLLCEPDVSSATNTFLFLLRNTHTKKVQLQSTPII